MITRCVLSHTPQYASNMASNSLGHSDLKRLAVRTNLFNIRYLMNGFVFFKLFLHSLEEKKMYKLLWHSLTTNRKKRAPWQSPDWSNNKDAEENCNCLLSFLNTALLQLAEFFTHFCGSSRRCGDKTNWVLMIYNTNHECVLVVAASNWNNSLKIGGNMLSLPWPWIIKPYQKPTLQN